MGHQHVWDVYRRIKCIKYIRGIKLCWKDGVITLDGRLTLSEGVVVHGFCRIQPLRDLSSKERYILQFF